MIGNRDGLMSPLIGTFYQRLGISDTVHITHLGVAVKLYPFLRTGIHSRTGKIGNFLNACNISDGQLTVKTINGCNSFQFQEGTFFYTFRHFRNLFVTKEHLHNNTVRKISHREDQDRFLISDLTGLHIHNLASDDNFSHLSGDTLQRDRFSVKIPAVNHIRIAVSAESEPAAEIAFLAFLLFPVKGFLLRCFFSLFLSGSFLRLFFGCFLLLRFTLLISAKFGMFQDILHFLFDLKCGIFPVFTLFRLHKIQVYFQIHPTSFTENFMKVFDEDFALPPGDHRIRKFHTHGIFSGKCDLRSSEQIVL